MKKLAFCPPQSRHETASNAAGSREATSIVAPAIDGARADALMTRLLSDPAELTLVAAKGQTPGVAAPRLGRATARRAMPRHRLLPWRREGAVCGQDHATGSSRRQTPGT